MLDVGGFSVAAAFWFLPVPLEWEAPGVKYPASLGRVPQPSLQCGRLMVVPAGLPLIHVLSADLGRRERQRNNP